MPGCAAAFPRFGVVAHGEEEKGTGGRRQKSRERGKSDFVSCVLAPRPHTAQLSTFLSIKAIIFGGP